MPKHKDSRKVIYRKKEQGPPPHTKHFLFHRNVLSILIGLFLIVITLTVFFAGFFKLKATKRPIVKKRISRG